MIWSNIIRLHRQFLAFTRTSTTSAMQSTSSPAKHWSYIDVMDIPHFDALYARKHEALMHAMAEPNPHGGTEADERARIYTFLIGIPEQTLKRVARKFQLRTSGGKTELVYVIFLWLQQVKHNGGNVYTKLIANEYCPLFDDFLAHADRVGQEMEIPPNSGEMRAVLGEEAELHDDPYVVKTDPHSERDCVGQAFFDKSSKVDSTPLSLSEFFRLMLILCSDEVTGPAMQKLAMDVSVNQENQEGYRDNFWRLVESRYNNTVVNFSTPVPGVNPSQSVARRDWRSLKAHFEVSLGKFMTFFGNWERVARGKPQHFERMLYRREGEFCTCSRRALIMFQVGMKGDGKDDYRILRRWASSVYYGWEEGIPASRCIEDY